VEETEMNLKTAHESGRRYRRNGQVYWMPSLTQDIRPLSLSFADAIAEDYEIEPEEKPEQQCCRHNALEEQLARIATLEAALIRVASCGCQSPSVCYGGCIACTASAALSTPAQGKGDR